MRDHEQAISRYTTGTLRERLFAALRAQGLDPGALAPGDLGEADQFHSGGSAATADLIRAAGIVNGTRVLDVGSGIGGAARAFAALGADVTAVDLTEEFTELARELNHACGLGSSITSLCAAAEVTGLASGSFDVATMLHVGMNMADKAAVFAEVHRLLVPGGVFGIYDLMGSNELTYPQPWANEAAGSFVDTATGYRAALEGAGFQIEREQDKSGPALAAMAGQGKAQRERPTPLGIPIILGSDPADRIGNVMAAMGAGALAPMLLVARRR